MIYKLQNGEIIKLQKGKMIPKLLQKIRTSRFDKATNRIFKSSVPDAVQRNIEAGKIGWAPRQTSNLWHNSNDNLSMLEVTFPAWDVVERGAPLGHSWLSGSETTSGFLAKRPYRLIAKDVTISKPLIQIGEAIGDSKNVTRNQILNFAQKSSADGMHFSGIADNQLQNQDIYALFKDVPITGKIAIGSRPISEAELKGWPKQFRNQKRGQIPTSEYSGLPKGERNNGRYGDIRFIRHMDVVPELTEDGFVQVAPKWNWLANFTTDQLMVPHKGYPITGVGKNVLVISPEAFRGTTPFSLDPGDSFFVNHELKIKPKHVTFISGDPQSIRLAQERGFNIESSPKLKLLSSFMTEDPNTIAQALDKRGYWFYGRDGSKIKKDYVDELNRILHTRFNRPSLEDYSRIESVTGVPTHTYSRSTAPWQSFFGPKAGYKQVIYDTTPQIESDLMKQIGSYPHPMEESMKNYSPVFFRLLRGWTPIKKQGGTINRFKNHLK